MTKKIFGIDLGGTSIKLSVVSIEGEIIDKRFLAARPDVERNQEIVALFKSSGVTISITAISQSEGNVGDYVMLKSPKYQRVYRGKVIAPNRVLVIM